MQKQKQKTTQNKNKNTKNKKTDIQGHEAERIPNKIKPKRFKP